MWLHFNLATTFLEVLESITPPFPACLSATQQCMLALILSAVTVLLLLIRSWSWGLPFVYTLHAPSYKPPPFNWKVFEQRFFQAGLRGEK